MGISLPFIDQLLAWVCGQEKKVQNLPSLHTLNYTKKPTFLTA
jgi:hypothetical protein